MRVLLVHGMGRTPLSLFQLTHQLRRRGYRPELVGYIAAIEPFDQIVGRLRTRLEAVAGSGERYAVLGHSLGGLALRVALPGIEPRPARLIMLGTPNQPPRLATRFRRWLPYRLLCGESGQLVAEPGFFANLPAPTAPYTIIAGTAGPRGRRSPFGDEPNDWVVAVSETRVRPSDEPLRLPVGHTFMMHDRRVLAAVRRALDEVAGTDGVLT